MSKLSKSGKIGLAIELIACLIMVVLVFCNQPIPDVILWIYIAGVVITLSGLFIHKKDDKN
jgi:uncharacterized membrane protein